MRSWAERECRRRCWAVATSGGGLTAIMLWHFARIEPGLSAGVGAVLAAGGGLFLCWGFCAGAPEPPLAGEAGAGTEPETRPDPFAPAAAHEARASQPAPSLRAEAAAEARPDAGAPPEPGGRIAATTASPHAIAVQPERAAGPTPPAPLDKGTSGRGSPGKPVARRGVEEKGLLGAVARTHAAGGPSPEVSGLRLKAPRGGRPDDLKLIRGVGPALERLLNAEGVWHFDQIAAWKARDIAAVDARLGRFRGRITRDEWVRQARILAAAPPAQRANGEAQHG